MNIHKLREVKAHADYYKIKYTYEPVDVFEYKIVFSEDEQYTNGHKAILFIDRLVEEKDLTPYTKPYRVGFGWEIPGK
jgi:hypothetical protein